MRYPAEVLLGAPYTGRMHRRDQEGRGRAAVSTQLLLVVIALLVGIVGMHALTGFSGHGSGASMPAGAMVVAADGSPQHHASGSATDDTAVANGSDAVRPVASGDMGAMMLCLAVLAGTLLLLFARRTHRMLAVSRARPEAPAADLVPEATPPRPPSLHQLCVSRT
jgi:hypothetical protein